MPADECIRKMNESDRSNRMQDEMQKMNNPYPYGNTISPAGSAGTQRETMLEKTVKQLEQKINELQHKLGMQKHLLERAEAAHKHQRMQVIKALYSTANVAEAVSEALDAQRVPLNLVKNPCSVGNSESRIDPYGVMVTPGCECKEKAV